MSANWTLTYGATEKTFAAWGIVRAVNHVESQGQNLFAFDLEKVLADADAVFPYLAEVTIKTPAGAVWFVGRRLRNPRVAAPRFERHQYVFSGPGLYLERHVFNQTWVTGKWGESGTENRYSSQVILGQSATGTYFTTGEQIEEIVQWVVDRNTAQYAAPKLQLDTSDLPAINAPLNEVVDITCDEAIRTQLRWSPDAVTWWDFATTPPTLRIKRRADLTPVTLSVFDALNHETLNIESCDDLVRPSVRLSYRKTSVVDGVSLVREQTEIAPVGATGFEEGVLASTYNLDGGTTVNLSATITAQAVDATSLAWWKSREPKLNDNTLSAVSVVSGSGALVDEVDPMTPVIGLALTEGQITEWMEGVQKGEVATAKIAYTRYDRDVSVTTVGAVMIEKPSVMTVSARYQATDLESGTYRGSSTVGGEPVPTGLAAQLYSAVSVLHWKGTITFVEREVTGLVKVGQVLNLSNGRAEWATMNALVQSVTYDLDAGRTEVTIGPAPFLEHGDLIDLLRVNRSRKLETDLTIRTAAAASASNGGLGQYLPRSSASPMPHASSGQRWIDTPSAPSSASMFIEHFVDSGSGNAHSQIVGATVSMYQALSGSNTLGAQMVAASGSTYFRAQNNDASEAKLSAEGSTTQMLLTDGTTAITIKVVDCGGHPLAVRELETCEDGVTMHRRVVCSEAY